jgi:hypothetical protein
VDEVKPVARVPTVEHREPCESRGSRTVLGAPGGEIPPGDSTRPTKIIVSKTSPLYTPMPTSEGLPPLFTMPTGAVARAALIRCPTPAPTLCLAPDLIDAAYSAVGPWRRLHYLSAGREDIVGASRAARAAAKLATFAGVG